MVRSIKDLTLAQKLYIKNSYENGMSVKEISLSDYIDYMVVRRWLKLCGVYRVRKFEIDDDEIVELWNVFHNASIVRDYACVSKNYIYEVLRKRHIPVRGHDHKE